MKAVVIGFSIIIFLILLLAFFLDTIGRNDRRNKLEENLKEFEKKRNKNESR